MDPDDHEKCTSILKFLQKHEDAWPFREPVDPIKLGIPDYFIVIKHPMDLSTIQQRLGKHQYTSPEQVRSDIDLMFDNALTYNQPGSDICKMAKTLQNTAKRKFSSAKFSLTNGSSQSPGVENSSSSKRARPVQIKSPSNPTPPHKDKKRKLKEEEESIRTEAPAESPPIIRTKLKVNKDAVPMTFDEKRDLGRNINRLNPHQLTEVVEIIKGARPIDTEKEDIEVDMNDLDIPTLRKLERFVNSCLSTMKEDPDGRKKEKISS
jgi:hypothetical protein